MTAIPVTPATAFYSEPFATAKQGIIIYANIADLGTAPSVKIVVAMPSPVSDDMADGILVWESSDINAPGEFLFALHPSASGADSQYTDQAAVVLPHALTIGIEATEADYEVTNLSYAFVP